MTNEEAPVGDVGDTIERDRAALNLRVKGRSLAFIARELKFSRAVDANEAFNRALRRCSDTERDQVVAKELKRLDALESADGDDENADRRARAIKGLRQRLLRD